MVKPTVDIVIVNYNAGIYLKNCIFSLKASLKSNFKLNCIVVDNASSDDSISQIKHLKLPWLTIINHPENVGFAAGCNIGIKKSKGSYVLLLNPDTKVSKDTIVKMVDFLSIHPKAGIVTPKLVLSNGQIDPASHRGFPTPWVSFSYFIGLEKFFPSNPKFSQYHMWYKSMDKVHEIDSPSGAFMLIKKEVINKIGLLDEDFFMYAEDIDFSYRAKKAGFQIFYNPSSIVLHTKGISSGIKKHSEKKSKASIETRLRTSKHFYETMKIFYHKHYSQQYPKLLEILIFLFIDIKKNIKIFQLKYL